MTTLPPRGVPVLTNPSLSPGLDALRPWLLDHHYSSWATDRIAAQVAVVGELASAVDAGLLDPEDLDGATDAFVSGLEPAPFDSPAWDDPAVYLDRESILEAAEGLPADTDRSIPAGAVLLPPELADDDEALVTELHPLVLAPIRGGSPAAPQVDDDSMAFPRSSPSAPLPDRLTAAALANVGRVLAAFDRPS